MKKLKIIPCLFKRTKLYNTPYHEAKESKFRIFEPNLVPNPPKNVSIEDLEKLQEFLTSNKPITLISGAGLSTESGIPDYRSPNGSYSKGHRPILVRRIFKVLNFLKKSLKNTFHQKRIEKDIGHVI